MEEYQVSYMDLSGGHKLAGLPRTIDLSRITIRLVRRRR